MHFVGQTHASTSTVQHYDWNCSLRYDLNRTVWYSPNGAESHRPYVVCISCRSQCTVYSHFSRFSSNSMACAPFLLSRHGHTEMVIRARKRYEPNEHMFRWCRTWIICEPDHCVVYMLYYIVDWNMNDMIQQTNREQTTHKWYDGFGSLWNHWWDERCLCHTNSFVCYCSSHIVQWTSFSFPLSPWIWCVWCTFQELLDRVLCKFSCFLSPSRAHVVPYSAHKMWQLFCIFLVFVLRSFHSVSSSWSTMDIRIRESCTTCTSMSMVNKPTQFSACVCGVCERADIIASVDEQLPNSRIPNNGAFTIRIRCGTAMAWSSTANIK